MYTPNGKIDKTDFVKGLDHNSDGIGIMYVEEGRVVVKKTVNKNMFDDIVDELNEQDQPKLLHMRYATHGSKDVERCHPFKVLSKDEGDKIDLYLMHNGVLRGVGSHTTKSDTQLFAERWLRPILRKNHKLLQVDAFQALLEDFIGTNNKLVFLDSDGNITLINEGAGLWANGTWLSSPNYVSKRKRSITSANGVYTAGDRDSFDKVPEYNYSYGGQWGAKSTTTNTTATAKTTTATTSSLATTTKSTVTTAPKAEVKTATTTAKTITPSTKTTNVQSVVKAEVATADEKKSQASLTCMTKTQTHGKDTTTLKTNTPSKKSEEDFLYQCDSCGGLCSFDEIEVTDCGNDFQLCPTCMADYEAQLNSQD